MRRAIILATLTLLLFAVAGVTAARENIFTSSPQDADQTELTALESTGPELTAPEASVPETTVPEATVPGDVEKPDEGTVETTVVVPEEPKEPGERDPGAENHGGVRDDNRTEVAHEPASKPGKPVPARGGKKNGMLREKGKPEHPGKPPVRGKPDDVGETGEKPAGGKPGKVTICHKDRVTISVGAPAQPAHLRHGDSLGAC